MSITVAALSTTFTPAATCTNLVFSSPIYKVWLNEPVPASGTTLSDCFPSQWLQGYASASPSSSIAPMMSPLVCPSGWTTAFRTSTSYIACCPSSYALHYPDTTVDTKRPAYGGTCFSDVTAGQTLAVTLYGDSSIIEVRTVTSTTNGGQVFAHPIDGIMAQLGTQAAATTGLALDSSIPPGIIVAPTAGQLPAAASATSTPSSNAAKAAGPTSLSTADVVGIVLGVAGAVALIAAIVVFHFYRRSHSRSSRNTEYSSRARHLTYDRDEPPPTPAKDLFSPISKASSIRMSPTYLDDKRAYPNSGSITPQRPTLAYGYQHRQQYSHHPRGPSELEGIPQGQRHDIYSPTRGPAESVPELYEIYSPTRESRQQMPFGTMEMEGSSPGGYDYRTAMKSNKSSVYSTATRV